MKKFAHLKLQLAAALLVSSFSMAADREQVKAIGANLMCICGCNQTLTGCTMIACPSSVPMKAEVAQYLDEGKNQSGVLAAFVDKYGVAVLSAPPASGFNLLAWVTPFVALMFGGGVVVYFFRHWRNLRPQAETASAPARYEQRLEEELKNYTPED